MLPDGVQPGLLGISGGLLRTVTPGGVGSIAFGGFDRFDDDQVILPGLVDLREAPAPADAGVALVDVGALRGLELRDPGPLASALVAAHRGEAILVLDGDITHTAMIRFLFDLLGPDALCLTGGAGRTLPEALRFVVQEAQVPLVDAVRAAATTPARILGRSDRAGALLEGLSADLLVLDVDLQVVRRMQQGRWLDPAS